MRPKGSKYRARDYYDMIVAYIADTGYPPSYREIWEAMEVTKSAVPQMLHKLERMGMIERDAGRFRAIRILRDWPERDWPQETAA